MSGSSKTGSPWVCLRTEPQRETFAEQNLRRGGLEVYCPRYQRWVSHARRKQLVWRPLFPNYLFARSPDPHADILHVKRTPGVASLAARDLTSALAPDAIIAALRLREGAESAPEGMPARFQKGEAVRVLCGPLAGVEAIFSEPQDDRRCSILLSLLGKQHAVTVPMETLDSAA